MAHEQPRRLLRTEAGRNPHDKGLTDLVGELVTRSEDFRSAWARHDVRLSYSGQKHFRHPVVGDLTPGFDAMQLPAQPALSLTVMTAESRHGRRGLPEATGQLGSHRRGAAQGGFRARRG
ncbi:MULTISPECIES: hypothetical protein [Streptomyces]|uniref:MmyB-like transcription regulator ligand binding domain-containing protein n=2 Tax=Streptomyces TaxID=1883 RepID=A0ABV9IVZ4_9ACTN